MLGKRSGREPKTLPECTPLMELGREPRGVPQVTTRLDACSTAAQPGPAPRRRPSRGLRALLAGASTLRSTRSRPSRLLVFASASTERRQVSGPAWPCRPVKARSSRAGLRRHRRKAPRPTRLAQQGCFPLLRWLPRRGAALPAQGPPLAAGHPRHRGSGGAAGPQRALRAAGPRAHSAHARLPAAP